MIDKFANVEIGKVYTIFMLNDFGMLSRSVVKPVEIQAMKYAQYDKAVKFSFNVKRKRFSKTVSYCYIHYNKTFAIFEGEHDWNGNWEVVSSDNNVDVRHSKYLSCDVRYVTDVINNFAASGIECIAKNVRD